MGATGGLKISCRVDTFTYKGLVLQFVTEISGEHHGLRLDQALAALLPQHSRSRLQNWIKKGAVLLNGAPCKPKDTVYEGDEVVVDAEDALSETAVTAQDIPLDVVYDDATILVVNKPADFVVHPAAGNPDGTLQNALLFHYPEIAVVPRSGIVHRLDKDTTGLMVVAKTLEAHTHLVAQLQQRSVKREYLALVDGEIIAGDSIETFMGRHSRDRKKMAVTMTGKEAITHYRVEERFWDFTLVRLNLETGRTHQIRVHMAHIHHPIIGDPQYGGRLKFPKGCSDELKTVLRGFKRQALHATRLGLIHPETEQAMSWAVAPPEDFQVLIGQLREECADDDDFFDF